ncbi:isocitrate dehydrogenase kinase/phosphatase [Sinobacterium caligoides]|uniref:Isocitrate dehydrogenase kinase/phosphatase n=1 Tax=Sinobacterium caligoides TaxID=933926 RepID=A0A3N2DP84_9GAMM|nr:bifunctional isocitrate dehydrogenase kinase/phosphatase [Sinobacterium caligoides]ROS01600.1 isocitrate dehydrogenase kinase/phosphatase [Sinobacterium caligoides]
MTTSVYLARTILNSFEAMFADFQNVTLGAKARFEQADWLAVHSAQKSRLEIYKAKIAQLTELLRTLAGERVDEGLLWRQAKRDYLTLISHHINYEIAESFFNSIYCSIFKHRHISDNEAFVLSSKMAVDPSTDFPVYRSYNTFSNVPNMIRKIIDDYPFDVAYEDLDRDIRAATRSAIENITPQIIGDHHNIRVDVLNPVFFRNKGAYLVGRILNDDTAPIPFVLPIVNAPERGLRIDTLIFAPDEVSVIFSFTRWYFMVDSQVPSQIVSFLHGLMPQKRISELYSCIGFRKHAKTEFYRDFIDHLASSDDQFVVAPGIKGMVMAVFTLPSLDIVFKLIKDKFTPPKEVTADIVREKYRLVTRSDRVGRMADTQEFKHLRIPKHRFSDELLAELYQDAPSLLSEEDGDIIIKHLYTERRMTPLNLYLRDANDQQLWSVMDEYGNAIKELAAANIFPGDMLLKNFGVTRHGRVVFYDYDEICHITDCHFRSIPAPMTPEQEMASTPWYSVGEFDIFPEEFGLFFAGNRKARQAFDQLHSDLYSVEFWLELQKNIQQGQFMDVFPYRRNRRFIRDRKPST